MHALERLDCYLEEQGLAAVWLAEPNSFTWLTGGDNVVSREATAGVAAVGYDGEKRMVVTDTIEAPRLAAEELDDEIDIETFEWYETTLAETIARVSPEPAAADIEVPGFETMDPSSMRQPLSEEELDRYRSLSRETAEVLEQVCQGLTPETTERAAAARLRGALAERNIDTPVALVGGSERAQTYRHFTPKDVALDEYALLSVTAVRDGLHASATRTVAFDPPEWLGNRTEVAMRVETTALAATRAVGRDGGTAADVFAAIQDAYAALGYDGEWTNHHQGGAAGYAGREWFATPTNEAPVVLPMAYAWNPTVQGAKSEDTAIVTEDEVEVMTTTGDWPTTEIDAVDYDLTLERHDVLHR